MDVFQIYYKDILYSSPDSLLIDHGIEIYRMDIFYPIYGC